jgi:predicted  nucleic acid-binding Zn-ribbon protein
MSALEELQRLRERVAEAEQRVSAAERQARDADGAERRAEAAIDAYNVAVGSGEREEDPDLEARLRAELRDVREQMRDVPAGAGRARCASHGPSHARVAGA